VLGSGTTSNCATRPLTVPPAQWVEPAAEGAGRVGLTNLKRRLALLYGEKASLDTRHTPAMVKVCLSLPNDAAPR
jgi:LytS/YehU family sensor histidine kinase